MQMIGLNRATTWVFAPSEGTDAKNPNGQYFKKDLGNFIGTGHDGSLTGK
jgi:hypothetical protein